MSSIAYITPKCDDRFRALVGNSDDTNIQVINGYTEASFVSKFSGDFSLMCKFSLKAWPYTHMSSEKTKSFGIRSSEDAYAEIWEKDIESSGQPRLVGITHITAPNREYNIPVQENQYVFLKINSNNIEE